ncbi:MAG: N-acyl homoserine lactonase family protein [Alphaproteobacteria bacterium]|nr:N-acyl homoserine lactonase family protein [Alphaproteobacteria bacterium]
MSRDHSIWSFCFSRGHVPADFFGGCPVCSNKGLVEVAMNYTLIATGPSMEQRRLVMVDTGFESGVSMTGRPFENLEMPRATLAKAGFRPEDVDLVVLTHLHFDHAGNFRAFPKARIVCQRREYDFWKEAIAAIADPSLGKSLWALSSMDLEQFQLFEQAVADGRVDFIDGDAEVSAGIHCRLAAESHTFGSQWVEVETAVGPHVIAGDCVYWYANLERMWPPGYTQGNPWNLMKTYERVRALVGEHRLQRVVPGHDMQIYSRHPSWTTGAHPVAEIHLATGDTSRIAGRCALAD